MGLLWRDELESRGGHTFSSRLYRRLYVTYRTNFLGIPTEEWSGSDFDHDSGSSSLKPEIRTLSPPMDKNQTLQHTSR
eukprot:1585938-Rhodomonas_salina.2